MSEEYIEPSRVILNYRGQVFVSIEDGKGDTHSALVSAVVLYNKLKADYDAEDTLRCLECAKENNIKAPEPNKIEKKIIDSPQAVL